MTPDESSEVRSRDAQIRDLMRETVRIAGFEPREPCDHRLWWRLDVGFVTLSMAHVVAVREATACPEAA